MTTATGSDRFTWTPSARVAARSNMLHFMRKHGIETPEALLARSQEDPTWFWDACVTHLGIEFSTPYRQVVDDTDPPFAKWFVGGKLNLAHDCVYKHALGRRASHPAIIWEGEDEGTRRLTYADLRREVALLADSLSQLGIGPGDAVGVFLPMVPEVVVSIYACAAIGAMAVPIFSGFAADAVAQRLGHCKAKAVICADGTLRRSKQVPIKHIIDEAVLSVPSVKNVIVWRRLGVAVPWTSNRDHWWHELTAQADATFSPLQVDSEHPFLLAYTSGTTGAPKAAVHVHGGFLAKIAEEAHFQTDLKPDDVLHWVTDMGWIMGPWEAIGTHAGGATLVLAEGAPDWPDPSRLWQLVDRHRVSILGVSPTLIRALKAKGDEWLEGSDRSSLRIFGSTGEPWNPEPYMWLSEKVGGGRCPIINLSGGTEVGACFLSPTPLSRLKPCTLGTPSLGMCVEVWDSDGRQLGPGEGVGELVCTKPWPGMTRGFFGEGGRERYLESYWSRWPGVWVHGDWASIDEDGLWYLHGRSDDTINVAGKRVGPAEYESILVDHESVAEAAAVGVTHPLKGEVVWCYVVLAPGRRSSDRLREVLSDMVADRMGKAFRPAQIRFCKALPKTRSAKIVRRVIQAVALDKELGDVSSVENLDAIKAIRNSR